MSDWQPFDVDGVRVSVTGVTLARRGTDTPPMVVEIVDEGAGGYLNISDGHAVPREGGGGDAGTARGEGEDGMTWQEARERLMREGIEYQDAPHRLVILGGPTCVIDYFLLQNRWKERGSHQHGVGLGRAIRLVRHRRHRYEGRTA